MVRYEDFVETPQETLTRIKNFTDIDTERVSHQLANHELKAVEMHLPAGNPGRINSRIELTPDYAWKNGLSTLDLKVIHFIDGRLMKLYGYR